MRVRLSNLLPLLLLALTFAVPAQEPSQARQIETEKGRWVGPVRISYNERRNETTCEIHFPVYGRPLDGIFLSVRNVSPGNKVAQADSLTLTIMTTGKDRTYLDDATLRLYFQGRTLILTAFQETYSLGPTIGVVRDAKLSFAGFLALTQAREVEMQIGPTRFTLTEARQKDLRVLLNATEPERPVYPGEILRAFRFPADSKASNDEMNAKLIATIHLRGVRFLLDEKLTKELKDAGANAELLRTIDSYLTPRNPDGVPDDAATIEKKKTYIRDLDAAEAKIRKLAALQDVDSKKKLIVLCKSFLEKYGQDENAVDMAAWARVAIPILERSVENHPKIH